MEENENENRNIYRDYSEHELLNEELIKGILEIPSAQIREHFLYQIECRAKELKIANNFKRLFKTVQADLVQAEKQKESLETSITNQPVKLKCKNYICNDFGIKKPEFDSVTMRTKEILVCTHPLLPVERLINIDNNIEKVKLAFYKDKKWQYVIAERNTLASKNKILQLANTGIEINENNAKEIITYISELIAINLETIPFNKAITHLGWTENGFVPYIENFKFDGDRSFESIYKDVKSKGDYELWKEKLVELRQSNQTLHFIVHLWGKSGTGKSVALIIAMSVWGNPKIGHLVKNLNSTNVGFERLSAFFNNIPFACDELQAIKSKYNNFNELIYTLTQGEGKSRGTADGGIQEQLKWNCAFITNGEEPITLESSKEGVKNRVIEIEENEAIIENGNQIVNFLLDNYGFAGKEFIENIPGEDYLKEEHSRICEELKKENSTSEKQINTISAILLADKLASKYIFFDTPLTIEQGMKYFTKDIDEAERIYNLIVDYFYQNINKFNDNTTGEFWGTYDTNADGSIEKFYFIPSVLRKFLSDNNINFDGIKSKLFDGGYIEKDKHNKFSVNQQINERSVRTISFYMKNDNQNQVQNDDFPF